MDFIIFVDFQHIVRKRDLSSQEPKAPGELIVKTVIRRLSTASSTFSNDFPSETAGPISIKFHIQHYCNRRLKICSNLPDLMTTMPIYGKTLKKSSSPVPLGWLPWSLVCSIKWLGTTKFVQMVTLGLPWLIFLEGQIWSLRLLNGDTVKHCIFPKRWYSVIWKKVLHAPLWIPKAKVIQWAWLKDTLIECLSTDFSSEISGPISSNFIYSILAMEDWKFVQTVQVSWTRWPPCP